MKHPVAFIMKQSQEMCFFDTLTMVIHQKRIYKTGQQSFWHFKSVDRV